MFREIKDSIQGAKDLKGKMYDIYYILDKYKKFNSRKGSLYAKDSVDFLVNQSNRIE